jgi:hypothetical protein
VPAAQLGCANAAFVSPAMITHQFALSISLVRHAPFFVPYVFDYLDI